MHAFNYYLGVMNKKNSASFWGYAVYLKDKDNTIP